MDFDQTLSKQSDSTSGLMLCPAFAVVGRGSLQSTAVVRTLMIRKIEIPEISRQQYGKLCKNKASICIYSDVLIFLCFVSKNVFKQQQIT